MERLGVGIIGVGRTANSHAQACVQHPGTELRAIAELDEAKGRAFAEKHQIAWIADYQALLARPDVDIAVILLPHFLHAAVACAALAAGKHVFIEKPMAMTTAECDQMLAAAARAERQIMVGHHHHFTAQSLAARRILQSGELGRPIMATDVWHKPFFGEARPAWFLDAARGGGMWPMNGSHLIDRLMFCTGKRVEAVRARVGSPIFGQSATDAGHAFLLFDGDFTAALCHAGYDKGAPRFETEYVLTKGMLKVGEREVLVCKENAFEPIELAPAHAMRAQFFAFADALASGGEAPTPGEYGREVVAVLEACELSSRLGREVVVADVRNHKLSLSGVA